MIYFLIVPIWLLGLVVFGLMAFAKPLRRISLHLALMSTFAVLLSFVLSLAFAIGLAAPFHQNEYAGLAFMLGYVGGLALGGGLGALLGHLLAERLAPLGLWRRLLKVMSRSVPG